MPYPFTETHLRILRALHEGRTLLHDPHTDHADLSGERVSWWDCFDLREYELISVNHATLDNRVLQYQITPAGTDFITRSTREP